MENNTKDRELFFTRTLNAPIDLVWKVWGQPRHIAQWWGPNGFTTTITTMDMKSGGEWNLIMHGPDGTDYINNSIFKLVIPYKIIVYEHISPKYTSTIEFEEHGEQTHISWRMLFETAGEFIQVVKTYKADEGLLQNIEKLESYLENIKSKI